MQDNQHCIQIFGLIKYIVINTHIENSLRLLTLIFFSFFCLHVFLFFAFAYNARIATTQQRLLCKYNTKGQQQQQKPNIT